MTLFYRTDDLLLSGVLVLGSDESTGSLYSWAFDVWVGFRHVSWPSTGDCTLPRVGRVGCSGWMSYYSIYLLTMKFGGSKPHQIIHRNLTIVY